MVVWSELPPRPQPVRHARWWLPGALSSVIGGGFLAGAANADSWWEAIKAMTGQSSTFLWPGPFLPAIYVVFFAGFALVTIVLLVSAWLVARSGGWVSAWLLALPGVVLPAFLYVVVR